VQKKYPHNRNRRDAIYGDLHDRYSRKALELILHLRGLYVKLGQILSSRPDFCPPQYVALFATVQDSIPQWDAGEVRQIMSLALEREFGLGWDDVFESMDDVALGSASIGQVHRAVLQDEWARVPGYKGGKVVAVKVMHPGAKKRFKHDFEVFRCLCRLVLPSWGGLLNELERRVMTEFDYRVEAASLSEVRSNVANSPYRHQVCIPEPLEQLCCKHVLVMQMLNGVKLIDAIEDGLVGAIGSRETAVKFLAERKEEVLLGKGNSSSYLESVGVIGKIKLLALVKEYQRYVNLLVDVHGKQIFIDGCFNGDPHFGNVLRLDDGRLGLIDYGQTRRLSDDERLGLAKVVSVLGQDSPFHAIAKAMREAGFRTEVEYDDAIMVKYAKLFFDSDQESEDQGFATPQLYFVSLMAKNALTNIPDAASKCKNRMA
jgi:aarF domain-containing kinase